ncbi:MAG: DoxX family protein [Janthinobacterium lividum]
MTMTLTKQQLTVAYWLATGLLTLFMAKSAFAYLTQEAVRVECQRLGFPDYFRLELALAKTLGVLALLTPVGPRLKEWTYAGFVILLGSAAVAHLATGEPLRSITGIVVLLGVLAASYTCYHQRQARAEAKPGR